MGYSNVVGFDDAPFAPGYRGMVPVVGAVYAASRLEGVVVGEVTKDGDDAARRLAALLGGSRFAPHVQLIMLQGITLAGFNVVDLDYIHQKTGVPVLAVLRTFPDLDSVRSALLTRVPGGKRKWTLIQQAGPPEPAAGVFVHRAGLSLEQASSVVARSSIHGDMPEPIRAAHLIAGALGRGESRGRV